MKTYFMIWEVGEGKGFIWVFITIDFLTNFKDWRRFQCMNTSDSPGLFCVFYFIEIDQFISIFNLIYTF